MSPLMLPFTPRFIALTLAALAALSAGRAAAFARRSPALLGLKVTRRNGECERDCEWNCLHGACPFVGFLSCQPPAPVPMQ